MRLKTRRVGIAGFTTSPNDMSMKQFWHDLSDSKSGDLEEASHLIVDRDASFPALRNDVKKNPKAGGVLLSLWSANLNTCMERRFASVSNQNASIALSSSVADHLRHSTMNPWYIPR